jgi:hypothetical protein
MNVIEGSISSTIESLKNYLAIDNLRTDENDYQPKVIAVYNVEKVAINELKRLDFLFALVERSFGHTNTIVILLWNTDDRPLNVDEAELHSDDGVDMDVDLDSQEDGQMFYLRDFLSKEWSKSGSLVNGEALAGRLAGTAHCPTCYTSSESDRGATPSPLTACQSNKEELDRILLDRESKKKVLLNNNRCKQILSVVLVLIVTCFLSSSLIPKPKAVEVVDAQEQPVPTSPLLADLKTSKTDQNGVAIEAEGTGSGVEGTDDSVSCDPVDKFEPAGDDAEPSASDSDTPLDSAESDSLLPEPFKALSHSVQEILPLSPRYHTRSRFKD